MMSRFPSLDSALVQRMGVRVRASHTKKAAVFAVLAAVGALAWAGCGSSNDDRYYCDNAGCYQCDAYGCSNVSPPAKQACTGASSCAAGSVCTATGCTTTCSDGVPCAKGEVCKDGLCAAPAVDPGTKKECTTKADCGDGKACVANTCEACGGSAGPCPCTAATAATDCTSGQTCVAGSCTAPVNTCKFSSECGDGKICDDGQCLTGCGSTPCADGFTCTKGACQPTTGGSGGTACMTDQQCSGDTPQCVAGSCAKACTGDAECGGGKFCDQGACVIDTRPQPNCTDDSQCGGSGAPRKCQDGFCKYTCTAAQGDAYCRTIDNRIGTCAKDLVCRSAAEAAAQCVAQSDCAIGQDCVDNTCK